MKKTILLLVLNFSFALNFFAASPSSEKKQKIPTWFTHSEMLYPSELFLSAQGEGDSVFEAEMDCLSKISLYFNTNVQTASTLARTFLEETQGENYLLQSKTETSESIQVSTQAQFFCVQWEKPLRVGEKFYAFAYMNRDDVFRIYGQRIKICADKLESILISAENYNNPIYGFEAAQKGIAIAELTEQYIVMASTIQKTAPGHFSEEENLCKRIRSAYEICKANLIFQIEIENDLNGGVKRTLGKLLEAEGYNVSDANGECKILGVINIEESQLEAGSFFSGGIEINIVSGTGEKIFSWSRNVSKTGSPNGKEKVGRNLFYKKIQNELEENFTAEFKEKVKL
ncbi:MAG: hypothetical protein K2N58_05720 [Treponemataceae bacterium]|nr:hypothetical protein [Treponemataceae bacterium]